MPVRPYDEALLRRSFAIAAAAREAGDHPFGCLLADADGNILMEQGNGYSAEGGDRTAQTKKQHTTHTTKTNNTTKQQQNTLYTAAEPCAMCSGALYWAGIGRVVFGQTEKDLKAQTGAHEENPTLDLPCYVVFGAGQRPTEIVGPLLADEAARLQADFWSARHN